MKFIINILASILRQHLHPSWVDSTVGGWVGGSLLLFITYQRADHVVTDPRYRLQVKLLPKMSCLRGYWINIFY